VFLFTREDYELEASSSSASKCSTSEAKQEDLGCMGICDGALTQATLDFRHRKEAVVDDALCARSR
jgi:hypothetical protein